jgi:sorting nexin-9/18/33
MSRAERSLSYSLLSLITSRPLASTTIIEEEDEEEDEPLASMDKGKGTMNSDGAWCWREGCAGEFKWRNSGRLRSLKETNPLDCLKLTKSMQKSAEALQRVADMYDDHARRAQLITHESFKDVSHPYTIYTVCLSCPAQGGQAGD